MNRGGTSVHGDAKHSVGSQSVPAGTITIYAGGNLPVGYLWCNGAVLSRTEYSNLFAVLGETYGAGDGSTTFSLPNAGGCFLFGDDPGAGYVRGGSGGASAHTLTVDEMPSHNHSLINTGNVTGSSGSGAGNLSGSTGNAGGGNAHNNMPPFLVVVFIIKY